MPPAEGQLHTGVHDDAVGHARPGTEAPVLALRPVLLTGLFIVVFVGATLAGLRVYYTRTVTLPLSLPGLVAGALLCFIPITGEFIIPDLLGGTDTLMLGRVLWSEFFSNRDWPLASAVAVVLLVLVAGPVVLFREAEARRLERPETGDPR